MTEREGIAAERDLGAELLERPPFLVETPGDPAICEAVVRELLRARVTGAPLPPLDDFPPELRRAFLAWFPRGDSG